MPLGAVYDAVVDAAQAALTAGPTLRLPNDMSGPPADRSMFVQLMFPFSTSRQVSMGDPGNNVMREEGGFRFVICAPTSTEISAALAVADDLVAAFNHAEFDGVRCWTPSSPTINDVNTDGAWYKVSVAVPYYYDYFA